MHLLYTHGNSVCTGMCTYTVMVNCRLNQVVCGGNFALECFQRFLVLQERYWYKERKRERARGREEKRVNVDPKRKKEKRKTRCDRWIMITLRREIIILLNWLTDWLTDQHSHTHTHTLNENQTQPYLPLRGHKHLCCGKCQSVFGR